MRRPNRMDRRRFLRVASGSALGVAVLGVACTDDGDGPVPIGDRSQSPTTTTGPTPDTTVGTSGASLAWERVDLGSVSAYVLTRDAEAAVVDTGTAGSADAIEQVLADLGLGWDAVGEVVLTHRHRDHVGSLPEVAARAPDAALRAGTDDVPAIDVDGVMPLADGDTVFGDLVVVHTPGHTPGHVAVHHPGTRLLVVGDALTSDGEVTGPNPAFTPEMDVAMASVARLAELDVDTVLVGHGPPVVGGAGPQIAALVG